MACLVFDLLRTNWRSLWKDKTCNMQEASATNCNKSKTKSAFKQYFVCSSAEEKEHTAKHIQC